MENPRSLSPEEMMFQRPSSRMDDIGYEGGMPRTQEADQPVVYSVLDMEQVLKFTHIHQQMDHVAEHVNQGLGYFVTGEDKEIKKENLVFMMNFRLLQIMHYMALHMYEEFEEKPQNKEAADILLQERRIDRETSEAFEIHELEHLWNTP